jgi:histidyl-tRNA synthetase
LVSKLGGSKLSAVGASLGFDRMFYALKSLQIIPQNTIYNKTKIIVLYPEAKNSSDAFRVALSLRKNNIPVDIYLDGENPLKSQMSYALKNNYKIAIIVGSQEIKENEVIVKVFDMYKQFKLKMENLAEEVGKFIE